ncbi:MAG: DUF5134 domain-containing protein [Streptosporangiaceae bacterium]
MTFLTGMDSAAGMGGPHLLPPWLRLLGIAVFLYVTASHVRHAGMTTGCRRAWHWGHVLMALGMVEMYLPADLQPFPAVVGEVVFGTAAALVIAWVWAAWLRGRAIDLLWVTSMVGMLGMIYMFALPEVGLPGPALPAASYVLAAYFAGEAVIWVAGGFARVGVFRLALPYTVGPPLPTAVVYAVPPVARSSLELRASLGLMTAGMAYMLVAMSMMPA